jgi:hypothetical protein
MRFEVGTMKIRYFFVLAVAMLWAFDASAQESSAVKPYDLEEAYAVYSVLLPLEESSGFAKGTLVIQQDTVSERLSEECLTAEAANNYKDAIADYMRVNSETWLLQRKFQVTAPYELVRVETILTFFRKNGGGWDGFYKRYPKSGGFVILSAVGFNKDKSKAIVYTGSSCGGLCGRWSFHLLEKVGGKWKETGGVACFTES